MRHNRPLTELDAGITDFQRRTVNDQLHFQRSISTDSHGFDEIDRELDEMIEVDPYNREPSSRKSDASLGRLLAILDNLPTGKDGE